MVTKEIPGMHLADLADRSASLLVRDRDVQERFIAAIEDAIGEVDRETATELLDYLRPLQTRARLVEERAIAAIKTLGPVNTLHLEPAEQHVLQSWLERRPTITDVLNKLGGDKGVSDVVHAAIQAYLDEPTDQERSFAVSGALLAQDTDGGLHLAVTYFRALLSGVSPRKLSRLVKILQIYCGLPAFTAAMQTLKTLNEVLSQFDIPPDDKNLPPPADVIKALRQRFGMVA